CYNRFGFEILDETSGETAVPFEDRLIISPHSCVEMQGVSTQVSESLFFKSLNAFYEVIQKERPPYRVEVEAHIPLARGLGSSSSVIAGALVGANLLEGTPLSTFDLIQLATQIEGHPDNVVPALLGGAHLCDVRPQDGQVNHYPLPWPMDWKIIIVVPSYRLLTSKARKVLPLSFSMKDAVTNLRKASLLTYALLRQDPVAFQESLMDTLHQPYRSELIPDFKKISDIAASEQAFGTVISGAGPSIAIFYPVQVHEPLIAALKNYRSQNSALAEMKILSLVPDFQGTHRVQPDGEETFS
ncbi:MAG: homoserine kinase, partial [Cyanobacteria bacterium]|nr:homoserine kinase [Cyanobacteriota bacterium]